MKAESLLSELRERGIQLSLRADDIVYRAPKGSISSELLARIKDHKTAIVDELRAELRAESRSSESNFDHLTQTLESDNTPFDHDHPFARYVEPIKARLLARVGLDTNFVRGEGCYLWDQEGTKYLDCISQYGGLPFGYNPEKIWKALERVRVDGLPSVATHSLLDSAGELAKRLLQLAPDGFEHVIFSNSGAEAIEVAIKLCRAARQRRGILSTRNGFHGLTTGALSATGSESFQNGFFVRKDDFQHVPFADADALEKVLSETPDHFAAFIVEPIQGEAGIVVPPAGYLQQVRKICDKFNVLMVVDEVQSGLGRTGRIFACEHDGVVPDVITLAKALGGGLTASGATLCQANAYSIRFGLRHSSTFAGNALASQCGLATLDALEEDSGAILRNVEHCGNHLLQGLKDLQDKYSPLVKHIRGRGFMLAIEFDFELLKSRKGLMPILIDQQLLLHLLIGYLLHVHQVRVAPTFMGRDVLRIEPPLIAGQAECDQLLAALDSGLEIVQSGNTAALVAGLIQLTPDERRPLNTAVAKATRATVVQNSDVSEINNEINNEINSEIINDNCPIKGEFGFLVHLSGLQDLVNFDSSLSVFSEGQLADLKHELTRSSEPTVVGTTVFRSSTGIGARGHFVLVPYTPTELLKMPDGAAVEHVAKAALVAKRTGAELIGLGGFTSIITHGGMALDGSQLPPLTTGNAYTVGTSLNAIKQAAVERNASLEKSTVAIVGAGGQIGRALALMLAENVAGLVLVGRDGNDERTRQGLLAVAEDVVTHLLQTAPDSGKLSQQIATIAQKTSGCTENRTVRIASRIIDEGAIVLAKRIEEIAASEIVVAVSSAVKPFIQSGHIKPGAIVCDSSRPANVPAEVIAAREDVRWIEGGLVRIPGAEQLDIFAGPHPNSAYACVAESALWTLEPELGRPSATKLLDVHTIRELESCGARHGFEMIV